MLRAVLQRELPDVTALDGTAEELPLETASADVACAGQAFHWFDLDRALDEFARVLRPRRHRHRGLELTARGRHLVRRRDRVPHHREPRPPAGDDAWTGPPHSPCIRNSAACWRSRCATSSRPTA